MAGSASLTSPFVSALVGGTLKNMGQARSVAPIALTPPNYQSLSTFNSSIPSTGSHSTPGASIQQNAGTNTGADPATVAANQAAAAKAAALAQSEQDFANQRNTTMGSINTAIGQGANTYQGSILDYLDSLKQQQNTINNESVQNELSKQTGTAGVLDMVGHGIRSGGVILANDNASNSSAPAALGRAYADLGRRQLSGVGNQYAQGQSKIGTEQTNLGMANTAELRHAQQDKTSAINNIVSAATGQLGQLNQMAAYASIPDRIQIDQQIAQIRQQAMDALSAYDQTLSQGINSTNPTSLQQNQASAASLRAAGTAPANAFQTSPVAPAEFQNSGPFASELPLFTFPGNKRQTA